MNYVVSRLSITMCRAAVIRYAYYFLNLIVYFSTFIFVVPIHLPLAPHDLTEVK